MCSKEQGYYQPSRTEEEVKEENWDNISVERLQEKFNIAMDPSHPLADEYLIELLEMFSRYKEDK
jgi:hypothetical protein